jgi:uncharacterized protein (TIGR02452 family)
MNVTNEKLARVAQKTMEVIKNGFYRNNSNQKIDISKDLKESIDSSVLYKPEYFDSEIRKFRVKQLRVVNESCLDTAYDLVVNRKLSSVSMLNFASAYHAGGNFIGGAMAQEEAIAYASTMYPTLTAHNDFYKDNKDFNNYLFTENMIYSPNVLFFKDKNHMVLDNYYKVDICTSPACNLSRINSISEKAKVPQIMDKRINNVLRVMSENNTKNLILGAFGCGVFKNNPITIANIFNKHLTSDDPDAYEFDEVVFSIYGGGKNYEVFNNILINKQVVVENKPMFRPTIH